MTRAPDQANRRGFFKKACGVVIGAIASVIPGLAGLAVFLDPLRRKTDDRDAVLIANLNALPNDGVPRKFPVISSHTDAWNRTPQMPIGSVYLRRTGEKSVQALNVVCPHAGCNVDYKREAKSYHCPCHKSSFALDGKKTPKSPSPRGMDDLPVEIRDNAEIWVRFQNFRAGTEKKIPV